MTARPLNNPFTDDLPGIDSLGNWAVFFDIDGTLLDLAESPEAVRVPEGLIGDLLDLDEKLGGALALVTGRSIAFVDTLFPETSFPVAGLHGGEIRDAAGRVERTEPTEAFLRAKEELRMQAARWRDILVEDKRAAIAVHYRQAPQLEGEMRQLMEEIAALAGPGWTLQRGKMVLELRPAAHDKGHAVETFMRAPPFVGRRPLAFGDDVTDEAMFEAVNVRGGLSVRIGLPSQVQEKREAVFRSGLAADERERPSAAKLYLEKPAALRDWISQQARREKNI
ncbi:trehalose-phosphatase [Brucella sp. IR073]|uniref:trehalose-phosphatase n=1 Tax=unclassified Brucella TaxID=2632610 RepID=UPI003B983272